jgi:glycosyltransferase involved in cell wall biosynthesis
VKILFLGDLQHPNSQNWVSALRKFGGCQVQTWSLPWPSGVIGKLHRIFAFVISPLILKLRIFFFKPDIIIGYRITSYGFLAALLGDKNIVIASQGDSDMIAVFQKKNTLQHKIKIKMARYAIRKSELIHVWSNQMAKSIYDLCAEKSKIFVMHRGIDLDNFNSSNKRSYSALDIIVTRSLYPEYRHNIIIQAMSILRDTQIPFTLKIIGSGIDEKKLKELVTKLNLRNEITFFGRLNNESIIEELENSNVYVAMPITEGVSSSLLEAMACHCIPVVTNLEANRLLIEHNKNGFLINIDDTQQLAITLIDIWHKLDKFDEVRKQNRILVKNYYSQENNIKAFIAEYKQIIYRAKVSRCK